ncbi:tRNA (5-methylaminomethyl-2-thiouridine)(34)-methyltransferase MnmD [Bacteroidota bacterium]
MKVEIIKTADQSHTLFVPELKEHYHSTYGAIQESLHVYINAGMNYKQRSKISIFELGFGTGLNAYLSYLNAIEKNTETTYYAIDNFPLEISYISQLNYPELIGQKYKVYNNLHNCKWNEWNNISTFFKLKKIQADIKDFICNFNYDVVYFDAFGPDIQPDLWEEKIFKKIIDSLNPQGIITTYSAKGIVKRILKKLGMKIETIQGPEGKRQMIRAIKI